MQPSPAELLRNALSVKASIAGRLRGARSRATGPWPRSSPCLQPGSAFAPDEAGRTLNRLSETRVMAEFKQVEHSSSRGPSCGPNAAMRVARQAPGRVRRDPIAKLRPENTVAWEGDAVRTVKLKPAGWGTRVTLTALVESCAVDSAERARGRVPARKRSRPPPVEPPAPGAAGTCGRQLPSPEPPRPQRAARSPTPPRRPRPARSLSPPSRQGFLRRLLGGRLRSSAAPGSGAHEPSRRPPSRRCASAPEPPGRSAARTPYRARARARARAEAAPHPPGGGGARKMLWTASARRTAGRSSRPDAAVSGRAAGAGEECQRTASGAASRVTGAVEEVQPLMAGRDQRFADDPDLLDPPRRTLSSAVASPAAEKYQKFRPTWKAWLGFSFRVTRFRRVPGRTPRRE